MRNKLSHNLGFIVMDIVAIELALVCTYWICVYGLHLEETKVWHLSGLIPLAHLALADFFEPYDGILQRGYLKELDALFRIKSQTFFVLVFLYFFLELPPQMSQVTLAIYVLLDFCITYMLRFLYKFHLKQLYTHERNLRHVMVAATEQAARRMVHAVTTSAIRNYQFFGLAILDKDMVGETIENVQVAASKDSLVEYVKRHVVDEVLIDAPDQSELILTLAHELLDMGVTVHISMEDTYLQLPNRAISDVFGYEVLTSSISVMSFEQAILKRTMDIIGGVLGCLATVLLIPFIGTAIYLASPGPIFFVQTRVGKGGRQFKMYNLRSMDLVRRSHEILGYIKANFCIILTTNFRNTHFRHQNRVFPAVETG